MRKMLVVAAFMCASLQAQVTSGSTTRHEQPPNTNQSVNSVIEWNRTLLVIVRTPGAQPSTVHSTRSFAILHAAIYDAVNNIAGEFTPYLVVHRKDWVLINNTLLSGDLQPALRDRPQSL
jgi:hypothetical protein